MGLVKRKAEAGPFVFAHVTVDVYRDASTGVWYEVTAGPAKAHDQARIFAAVGAYAHMLCFAVRHEDALAMLLLADLHNSNQLAEAAAAWQAADVIPPDLNGRVVDHPLRLRGQLAVLPDSRPVSTWGGDSHDGIFNVVSARFALAALYGEDLRTMTEDHNATILRVAMTLVHPAFERDHQLFFSPQGAQEVAGRVYWTAVETVARQAGG